MDRGLTVYYVIGECLIEMLHVRLDDSVLDAEATRVQLDALIERDRLEPSSSSSSSSAAAASSSSTSSASWIECTSGNPHIEEITGVLRLYSDRTADPDTAHHVDAPTMLVVLGIPSYMTVADVLDFAPMLRSTVRNFRGLRDRASKAHLLLLEFRDASDAAVFYMEYNGREFSSLAGDQKCKIVRVASFRPSASASPPPSSSSSYSSSVGASASSSTAPNNTAVHPNNCSSSSCSSSCSGSNGGAILKEEDELPTCTICLERLDATVSGIYTISCNHSFHCDCVARLPALVCPVCRYASAPVDDGSQTVCATCACTENLWMCMLCGSVGCGRYQSGHARLHFEQTSHAYAIELHTQRVWDYVGDQYVHRMVADSNSSKVVPLEAKDGGWDAQIAKMMDAQRAYYEGLLAESNAKVEAATKQQRTLEKRVLGLEKRVATVEGEKQEVQDLLAAVEGASAEWRRKCVAAETKCRELEEQVRDLMAHFEASEGLRTRAAALGEEIDGGEVGVTAGGAQATRERLREKLKAKQAQRSRR